MLTFEQQLAQGDPTCLADPALELHLIVLGTESVAWLTGARACADTIIHHIARDANNSYELATRVRDWMWLMHSMGVPRYLRPHHPDLDKLSWDDWLTRLRVSFKRDLLRETFASHLYLLPTNDHAQALRCTLLLGQTLLPVGGHIPQRAVEWLATLWRYCPPRAIRPATETHAR